MSNRSSHYSNCFDIDLMLERSKEHAKDLVEVPLNDYHIILVYSGMSGVNHATYLAIALNELHIPFSQIYVRKEHEKAHGRDIEYSDIEFKVTSKRRLFVFVDDFIDSGKTLHYITSALVRNTKQNDLITTALFNLKSGNKGFFPRKYRNFQQLYYQLTNRFKNDTM